MELLLMNNANHMVIKTDIFSYNTTIHFLNKIKINMAISNFQNLYSNLSF